MKIVQIPTKYATKIRNILKAENFSDEQIKLMLKGYTVRDDYDRQNLIENDDDDIHSFLERIPSRVEEQKHFITTRPYLKKQLGKLNEILRRSKVFIGEAKSLTAYSGSDNIDILYIKRVDNNYSKYMDKIQHELLLDIIIKLRDCNVNLKEKKFADAISFAQKLNPLDERSFQKLKLYLKSQKLERLYLGAFEPFLRKIASFYNQQLAIRKIDNALKNTICFNTVVYRGVPKYFVENILDGDDNYYELIGQKIEEKGYLSTSLTFLSSFAKDISNCCFKIYVPKGSEGLDITPFSVNRQEYELLLNSCDLYILDYYNDTSGIYDGTKTRISNKPTFVALLLSKNRECYKDIANKENENE